MSDDIAEIWKMNDPRKGVELKQQVYNEVTGLAEVVKASDDKKAAIIAAQKGETYPVGETKVNGGKVVNSPETKITEIRNNE